MAKILITGANGQLGTELRHLLDERGIEYAARDAKDMDITDRQTVDEQLNQLKPEVIYHCAAYTAVDKAEDEGKEINWKVNEDGTRNLAEAAAKIGAKLVYLSTDYVFDGQGETEWKEYDERHPLNVYGQTKYEGELIVESLPKHFIVRIAWVFGINGNNFIKTMLRLGKERGAVCVVDDQIGSPTYTYDLSKLVVDMIQTDKYGIYHATNEGLCSWYEFACEIFKQAGMSVEVTPVDSNAFPAKAKRPNNSRMSKAMLDKNGFGRLPTWQDALSRYLKEIDY